MKRLAKIAAAAVIALGAGTVAASAACNGDTSTETVLGAGSGALVGGLASHSIVGAAVGGVAGGLIENWPPATITASTSPCFRYEESSSA